MELNTTYTESYLIEAAKPVNQLCFTEKHA